ncbi:unnamed protein product, partial [Mesorhabditis belari]|uniref:Homeobox domain-containing protein n=1 Tax=Mesorhabditis belari TaxID=2138241 RepID=A0AAF3ERM5_9BILA
MQTVTKIPFPECFEVFQQPPVGNLPFGIFHLLNENLFEGIHSITQQVTPRRNSQQIENWGAEPGEEKISSKSKRGRRKLKKPRTSFTRIQIAILEQRFVEQKYVGNGERRELADHLQMSDAQVKTWFQNRRTKWRRQEALQRTQRNEPFPLLPIFNQNG